MGRLRACSDYILALVAVVFCAMASSAAYSDIIYQAFNERFIQVGSKAGELRGLGYTMVQVSPPQKSIDETIWWGRYQPIDLRLIEGPLGNERQFRAMIDELHRHNLKVVVDVIFNHMADPVFYRHDLQYPEFSWRDFHHHDTRPCIVDWGSRYQVTKHWLCDPAFPDRRLPDLNTSSEYVRGRHKAYLNRLLAMGVDGFRFDAAKHIEPEYFRDIVAGLPNGVFYYGEVIGSSIWETNLYTPYMKVSDFQLLGTMIRAFSIGGSLGDLTHPEAVGGALSGPDAVTFARNHDTAMHSDFFNFSDRQDALLATAFVVSRGVGVPIVYRDDYNQRIVRKAIEFHRRLEGKGTYVRQISEICSECRGDTMLAMERGAFGLVLINKANEWVNVATARMPGLNPGCYAELNHDFTMRVDVGGDGQKWISRWGSASRGGLAIGPRSAMFFAKTGDAECN